MSTYRSSNKCLARRPLGVFCGVMNAKSIFAARHLSLQLRHVEIAERHLHTGCNRPELLDERLDHCHLQVIRTGDSDDQLGLGGIEVPVDCNSGANLIERLDAAG